MAKQIGRLTHLGLAKETTRGTAQDSPSVVFPHSAFTFDQVVETVLDDSAIGVVEDSMNQQIEKQITSGNIEAKVDMVAMDVIWDHILGGVVESEDTPQAGVSTRVYIVNQSTARTPLTLFGKDRSETVKFGLAFLQSIQLSAQKGSFIRFTAPYIANKKETATFTPSYATPIDFLFKHGSLKLASNHAGLAAATAVNVRDFQITVNRNTEDDDAMGTDSAVDRLDKELSIELQLTVTYNGPAEYKDLMTGDTARALRFNMTNSQVVGASTNPSQKIDLYFAKISSTPVTRGLNDVLTQQITAKAMYSLNDGKSIEVTTVS